MWGNQALESLSHAHPAAAAAAAAAAPPPSPPASPNPQPAGSQHTRSNLGPLRASAVGGGPTSSADDDQRPSSLGSSRAAAGGTDNSPRPHQAISRQGSGRVSRGDDGSLPSPTTIGGTPSGGGAGAGVGANSTTSGGGAGLSPSSIAAAASSSEAQVAAWGGSLLRWLTGQFSTILRRAERCRVELRGAQETGLSNPAQTAAMAEGSVSAGVGISIPPESNLPEGSGGEGKTSSVSAGGLAFSAAPGGRGTVPVNANMTQSVREATAGASGSGGAGSMLSSSNRHGAASGAVAVSAKDIVVRAALAQARESAASEVLGMWEPARKGYEKVRQRRAIDS